MEGYIHTNSPADNVSENSPLLYRTSEIRYRTYRRRWYLLAVLALLNVSNGLMWITFSPVADFTAVYYNISYMQVNWLAMTFMVSSVPVGMFSTWFLDGVGIRASIIASSCLNVLGAALRAVSCVTAEGWRYPLLLTGQTLCAVAQPLMLFAPTKVAALWFPANQRALANTVSTLANPLGIMIGNLLSPVIVKRPEDISMINYFYTIPAGLGMILAVFGVCRSLPPTPPTSSAAQTSESFISGLKKVCCNKSYWVLTLAFGMGVSLFSAVNTLLEQILCPQGYSDKFAGCCSAVMIGVGLVGAVCAAVYSDRTKQFVEVAKCGLSVSVISFIAFLLLARYPGKDAWLLLLIASTGFFGFASNPISLELAVECTFPVAEATSAGLLILSGQVQSFVSVYVMELLARDYSDADVQNHQRCHTTGAADLKPQDYTYSNMCLTAYGTLVSLIFVVCFRCPYKRMQLEGASSAERVINQSESLTSSSGQSSGQSIGSI